MSVDSHLNPKDNWMARMFCDKETDRLYESNNDKAEKTLSDKFLIVVVSK